MADVEVQDRRSIRRFELQLPVTVTVTAKSGEQLQVAAKSRDVSSHGICFYCNAELERGSTIEFTVTLPADVTMTEPVCVRCSGKVVRIEKSSGSDMFAVAAEIDDYEFAVSNDKQNHLDGADAPPRL